MAGKKAERLLESPVLTFQKHLFAVKFVSACSTAGRAPLRKAKDFRPLAAGARCRGFLFLAGVTSGVPAAEPHGLQPTIQPLYSPRPCHQIINYLFAFSGSCKFNVLLNLECRHLGRQNPSVFRDADASGARIGWIGDGEGLILEFAS